MLHNIKVPFLDAWPIIMDVEQNSMEGEIFIGYGKQWSAIQFFLLFPVIDLVVLHSAIRAI